MGKYNSAIITTEGINMFASAIGGGDTVTFMTMQASSHAYPSTTDFMSLTSLQDVEATVNVNYAGVYSNNIVQVSARFDNDGVSTAYLINTLGLFAKLGNGEPKLVAVVTAQTPDQMPVYDANNPSAFIYNLQCTVQNAGSMAVSVNPAGTVTVEQFNEEMATKLGRTDNAVSATKLQTSRSLTVDLGSTTAASFDGSADASIGVMGELPITNGGTGANTQAGARSALGVPPTNHAVANTTYGSGTATNYGHVKLSDTYDTADENADAAHGVGASSKAVHDCYVDSILAGHWYSTGAGDVPTRVITNPSVYISGNIQAQYGRGFVIVILQEVRVNTPTQYTEYQLCSGLPNGTFGMLNQACLHSSVGSPMRVWVTQDGELKLRPEGATANNDQYLCGQIVYFYHQS